MGTLIVLDDYRNIQEKTCTHKEMRVEMSIERLLESVRHSGKYPGQKVVDCRKR